MADLAKRLQSNAPGEFFVDSTCIDCDTCNWVAPKSFDGHGAYSRVYRQPANDADRLRAEMALVACPVAAIGTRAKQSLRAATDAFPEPIHGPVYHCGFHARSSFGAASYLIRRPSGNIIVDSPRFTRDLAARFAAWGGCRTMFLTHCDDVADHRLWHEQFGCERVLHERDVSGSTRDIEHRVTGEEPIELSPGLIVIPVPGHTAGSSCLVVDDTYLFSGDHVAWSEEHRQIYAFRDACWYDWRELIRSMERLAEFSFEWILPGHGRRCRFDRARMKAEMARCIAWLKRQ